MRSSDRATWYTFLASLAIAIVVTLPMGRSFRADVTDVSPPDLEYDGGEVYDYFPDDAGTIDNGFVGQISATDDLAMKVEVLLAEGKIPQGESTMAETSLVWPLLTHFHTGDMARICTAGLTGIVQILGAATCEGGDGRCVGEFEDWCPRGAFTQSTSDPSLVCCRVTAPPPTTLAQDFAGFLRDVIRGISSIELPSWSPPEGTYRPPDGVSPGTGLQ